jgi:hypothetical protein
MEVSIDTGSRTRSLLAWVLVISQVAFSLVLVVGAGLFLRSLVNITRVDTGFSKQNVLRLNVDGSSAGYKSDDPRLRNRSRHESVLCLASVPRAFLRLPFMKANG